MVDFFGVGMCFGWLVIRFGCFHLRFFVVLFDWFLFGFGGVEFDFLKLFFRVF